MASMAAARRVRREESWGGERLLSGRINKASAGRKDLCMYVQSCLELPRERPSGVGGCQRILPFSGRLVG